MQRVRYTHADEQKVERNIQTGLENRPGHEQKRVSQHLGLMLMKFLREYSIYILFSAFFVIDVHAN